MTEVGVTVGARRRVRWLVIGVVVVVVVSVAVILVEGHIARVRVQVGLTLVEEGQDWTRTTTTTCAGAHGAESIGAGTTVEFVNKQGDVRGAAPLAELELNRNAPVNCYSPQVALILSRVDDVLDVRIDGFVSGQVTRAQIEEANAPDVYPGLTFSVTECASQCRIQPER